MSRKSSFTLRLVTLAALAAVGAAQAQTDQRAHTELAKMATQQQLSETDALQDAEGLTQQAIVSMLGDTSDQLDHDEQLAALSDRLPGFAGFKTSTDGRIEVLMTPASGLVSRGGTAQWRNAAGASADFARSLGGSVDVAAAQFDARELLTLKESARAQFGERGIHTTWIDHSQNRVYVGHDPALSADEVQALADSLQATGARRQAVVMVPLERVVARLNVNTSIQAQRQPLSGGAQFQYRNRSGAGFNCTVGVPAIRNGVRGFVTASHCSDRVYNLSFSTQAFAPVLGSAFLGTELADPAGTNCSSQAPAGCRFSDAAFFSVSSGSRSVTLGRMAFTFANSLTVAGSIAINGTASDAALGATVWKTGRTTGTRSGPVIRRCVDTLVGPAPVYLARCSSEVNSASFAAAGDSGSAVWLLQNNQARIVGVLSYGGGGRTGYSPWSGVTRELGSMAVR